MKKLILSALIVFALGVTAQAQAKKARLVADETTITESKTTLRVVTSNETIFKELITKMATSIKGYSVKVKSDRLGDYKEYTIPFAIDILPEVEEFIVSLNTGKHLKK